MVKVKLRFECITTFAEIIASFGSAKWRLYTVDGLCPAKRSEINIVLNQILVDLVKISTARLYPSIYFSTARIMIF
jgi:hypothetical protein